MALYSDRHSIFQPSAKEKESLLEQLEGRTEPTQFGRALKELGIRAIYALSPQAKGRIERLWGTLQDRLVSELRLAGASTLEEANQVLQSFLASFNPRFGVPPAQEGLAYRKLEKGLSLEGILCFKYQRTVAGDNTLSFGGHTLQLLPQGHRLSYTHARVEVQERLDGSLVVVYQGQVIATKEAPPHPVVLRARKGARGGFSSFSPEPNGGGGAPREVAGGNGGGVAPGHMAAQVELRGKSAGRKPAPDHPWRKSLLTKSLNN